MKKIYIILSTLLGAMIALASCQREDVPHNETPEEIGAPISFSTINASFDTKGDDGETSEEGSETGTTTPEISSFHVWASRTYGETANSTTDNSIFSGNEVRYDNGIWKYSPVRYWQTGNYRFVAVSQMTDKETFYTGSITNSSLNLNFTSPGWNLSSTPADLIVASATASGETQRNNNTEVAFTFDHQLAMVQFTAKNADTRNATISINSVAIMGNKTTASGMTYFASSTPTTTWTFSDVRPVQQLPLQFEAGKSAITLAKDTETILTSEFMVFPQDCTLEIEISYDVAGNGGTASNNSKSATKDVSWEAGKIYKYNINVTSDHISFVKEPTVVEWGTTISADADITI